MLQESLGLIHTQKTLKILEISFNLCRSGPPFFPIVQWQ